MGLHSYILIHTAMMMTSYSVKQLADIAKISVRTLHYYDEIDLLKPAFTGNNNYRYYGRDQLLRLQQILLYRELQMPLADIKLILNHPDFDVKQALRSHQRFIESEIARLSHLMSVIERSLATCNAEASMQDAHLYDWASPLKQAEYEAWLIERYGSDMKSSIQHSKKHFDTLNDEERRLVMDELRTIETDLVGAMKAGLKPEADSLGLLIRRHHDWVEYMWQKAFPPEAYMGLADLYQSHTDFISRYEALQTGFCTYLVAAIKAHAHKI